ncbi:MAG TPA: hypothetical protein VMB27_07590 [Solirubrobacteraceae bacterium]|nr:hypothetical protein [Solirubrobacteraceae bacterium]
MEHRHLEGSADAVAPRDLRAPLRRADIDRIWQRVTLVGRRDR